MEVRGIKKFALPLAGILSGFLNGLFGSGGGVAAVMFIRNAIEDEKQAHATSTLAILLMSAVSFILYLAGGKVELSEGLRFVPGGIAGAIAGCIILKKIEPQNLRRLFGAVVALGGVAALIR